MNCDFPTFSRTCIFFLLTSFLLLPDSSHSAFPSLHIVGSLTSKLPSMIYYLFDHISSRICGSNMVKHDQNQLIPVGKTWNAWANTVIWGGINGSTSFNIESHHLQGLLCGPAVGNLPGHGRNRVGQGGPRAFLGHGGFEWMKHWKNPLMISKTRNHKITVPWAGPIFAQDSS